MKHRFTKSHIEKFSHWFQNYHYSEQKEITVNIITFGIGHVHDFGLCHMFLHTFSHYIGIFKSNISLDQKDAFSAVPLKWNDPS